MSESATRAADRDAAGALQITVTDGYHGTVDQRTIDQWELHQARSVLAMLKEALQGDAMVELLAPQIEAGDERARRVAAESNGEWVPVESVFEVRGVSVGQFFDWLKAHFSDEPAMLAGNPEHFEIRMPEGVITETLGGIPTRFQIQLQGEPLAPPESFKVDPAFPIRPTETGGIKVESAILSTLLDGETPVMLQPVGMQARETEDGFDLKMTLYFPAASSPEALEDHSRHYAVEFSRWITMAYEEASRPASA
jgi:hypothetical protein